jgi:hypothetical protein
MKGKLIKKIVLGTTATLLVLIAVLGVHIYFVTKPEINEKTVAMARIDIKQQIDETQAGSIENWLSKQTGVDHVMLNRQSDIIVLTFYPVKVSADQLTAKLSSTFNIKAERFMPGAEQMKSGCPAMGGSVLSKLSLIFTHIFNHN